MIPVINEVLAFGIISLSGVSFVQAENMNSVILKYNKPVPCITKNESKILEYKQKANISLTDLDLLNGGYDN